jgi:hypothetical protein
MPTILFLSGWRFFFYSNEGNEPVHIHCSKAEKECKFWIDFDNFEIDEAYSFNMSHRDIRFVKKVIYQNLDYIVESWNKFMSGEENE